MIMIGPVVDSYSSYTDKEMQNILGGGKFQRRLLVHSNFMEIPNDLKYDTWRSSGIAVSQWSDGSGSARANSLGEARCETPECNLAAQ